MLSKSLRIHNVIIEGDALHVTSAVLGDSRDIPWSIRSVILEIRRSVGSFASVQFQQVPKAVNHLAHLFFQYAMHENVSCRWNVVSPPECISSNLSSMR